MVVVVVQPSSVFSFIVLRALETAIPIYAGMACVLIHRGRVFVLGDESVCPNIGSLV
jgi:hypothetical protein